MACICTPREAELPSSHAIFQKAIQVHPPSASAPRRYFETSPALSTTVAEVLTRRTRPRWCRRIYLFRKSLLGFKLRESSFPPSAQDDLNFVVR